MQYSPKLKKAMEEIKEIVKKYDIAAMVSLHSIDGVPQKDDKGNTHAMGYSEFLCHIDPSYSAATLKDNKFQVKNKPEHYTSRDARDIKIASTHNMLTHLYETTGMLFANLDNMKKAMSKVVEEMPGYRSDTTSHDQQNN